MTENPGPDENPFAGIFGDENGDQAERMKAARLEYEAYLGDVREMVDTHVQGFQNRGYSREEALFFGGQLHVLLTQLRRH